ncbi:glycosyltransferase family 10 domain-containing protein [Pontibacter sp. H249]|uniref:glycosyltransferase family 10 domain-containing protein n=1 Tax=Pontibacter sp. H249 TaxID=3133420 RepID=UPI0030C1D713
MKIVRVVKEWDFPDIMRQTPNADGIWNNIQFTTESIKEFDFLLVLNYPNENLNVRCYGGGKFIFIQEPPVERYQWFNDSIKYFDRAYSPSFNKVEGLGTELVLSQPALPWHINKSYSELIDLESEGLKKQNKVSWITSNKAFLPGHQVRLEFLKNLQQSGFQFDLFGRGFRELDDKFKGLESYKYSIAFENHYCNNYWTEKIADCYLSWTMPIYYGCTNIYKFFPSESMIKINPEDFNDSLRTIKEAISQRTWDSNLEYISEARELILKKYQIFPYIESIIESGIVTSGKKKNFYIPKSSWPNNRTSQENVLAKIMRKIKSW